MSAILILELLFKSGMIAGAGLILATVLHFRPAADRVDILRVTICLLIGLPLVMVLAPSLSLALLPPVETAGRLPVPVVAWAGAFEPVDGVALSGSILWPTIADLALWTWAAGALLVLGRFALGIWTLQRWTRNGRAVTVSAWTAPLERLVAGRRPRLVASAAVGSPLSWGMPPGVVLIGAEQLARPDLARAVLAHELAHVQRHDWMFLALSRVALGLFWFNPLVWVVHAALIARSEEAADAVALHEIDRETYARALVGLATEFNPSAALGMAGPAETLTQRIACIMKISVPLPRRPFAMAMAVGTLIAVATPIAALELTSRTPVGPQADAAPMTSGGRATSVASVAPTAPLASDNEWIGIQDGHTPPPLPPLPPRPPLPPLTPAPHVALPPAPPAPPAPPVPPAPPTHTSRAGWIQSGRPLTEQERQAVAEARQAAVEARIRAASARRQAAEAQAVARVHLAAATDTRAIAGVAREQAARETANARVYMAKGAEQMVAGARHMRRESARLRDPAYRAAQIERAREHGDPVTDVELQALSPRLATQADELEARAVQLRERAARQPS